MPVSLWKSKHVSGGNKVVFTCLLEHCSSWLGTTDDRLQMRSEIITFKQKYSLKLDNTPKPYFFTCIIFLYRNGAIPNCEKCLREKNLPVESIFFFIYELWLLPVHCHCGFILSPYTYHYTCHYFIWKQVIL